MCPFLGKVKGEPSQLVRIGRQTRKVIGEEEVGSGFKGLVLCARQLAVQPGPAVGLPRAREGGARQLLTVEPVWAHLRIVLGGGEREEGGGRERMRGGEGGRRRGGGRGGGRGEGEDEGRGRRQEEGGGGEGEGTWMMTVLTLLDTLLHIGGLILWLKINFCEFRRSVTILYSRKCIYVHVW